MQRTISVSSNVPVRKTIYIYKLQQLRIYATTTNSTEKNVISINKLAAAYQSIQKKLKYIVN